MSDPWVGAAPRRSEGRNRFTARTISTWRCVWDPTVHKYLYGEDLSFFILRLREPSFDLVDTVDDLCTELGISARSVYNLYGYYDCLLRVWCTSEQRDELTAALATQFDDAEVLREFRVARAYYDGWSSHRDQVTIRDLQQRSRDIELVSQNADKDSPEVDEAISTLVEARLLHILDPLEWGQGAKLETGGIKFYFLLTPTTDDLRDNRERVRRLVQNLPNLLGTSVYIGEGFADVLIKGVVAEFQLIEPLVASLYRELSDKGLHYRPTTLLIANRDAPESDYIDVARRDRGRTLQTLARTLGSIEAARAIDGLAETERISVEQLYSEFAGILLDTPFERFFLGAIEARLYDDPLLFVERLSFIMILEGMLRDFLFTQLLPEHFGREWTVPYLTSVNAVREAGGRMAATGVQDVTLHDLVEGTNKLAMTGDALDAGTELGVAWADIYEKLKPLVVIRDKVAHGHFIDRRGSRAILERWLDYSRAACGAGEIYNKLLALRVDQSLVGED